MIIANALTGPTKIAITGPLTVTESMFNKTYGVCLDKLLSVIKLDNLDAPVEFHVGNQPGVDTLAQKYLRAHPLKPVVKVYVPARKLEEDKDYVAPEGAIIVPGGFGECDKQMFLDCKVMIGCMFPDARNFHFGSGTMVNLLSFLLLEIYNDKKYTHDSARATARKIEATVRSEKVTTMEKFLAVLKDNGVTNIPEHAIKSHIIDVNDKTLSFSHVEPVVPT